MSRRRTILAAVLVLLPLACGGSGDSSPPPVVGRMPRVLIGDVEVPAGATSGTIDIALATESDTPPPTMLQFELSADPTRIRFATAIDEVVEVGDVVAGEIAAGRLRIVIGDSTSRSSPARLPTGILLRLRFDVVAGAGVGDVPIVADAQIGSDATGGSVDVESAPAVATIRLR